MSSVNLESSSTLSVVTNNQASKSFLSQQLCIVDSNSAEVGKYFTDPGFATADDLATARTREVGKFFIPDPTAVTAAVAAKANAAASNLYRVNDTIAATGAPGNVFTLPGRTFSGVCGYTNVVGFGLPLPSAIEEDAAECDVPLTNNLATVCTASTLNSDNLINNLRIAATKGSSPSYIAPTVSSMKYRARVGGNEQTLAAVTGVTSPAATYNATIGVCNFAVAEAHFTVTHTGAGSISSMSVALVYTDAINVQGTQWKTNSGSGVVPSVDPNSLRQKFSVEFVKSGSTAVPKSGSPGYVAGAPLLAGIVTVDPAATSTKEAVSRLVDGLPVPGASLDGHCGANFNSPVRFGMSQSSSCAVPLTKTGLQSFCEGTGSSGTIDAYMNVIAKTAAADGVAPTAGAPLPSQLTDGLFYSVATASLSLSAKTAVVAGWADASYLNVADWKACSTTDAADCATRITALAAPTETMSWDAATNTCKNVVIGINLDVLTAKVGTMDNPQSRVSRVSAEWEYGSWTYADPYASTSARQDFMLTSTVRFVDMEQASAEGVKPATPPIFPSLPADVFYPFISAGPAGGRAAASAAWWVAVVVALVAAAATTRQEC
jgi:tectonic-1/3